MIRLLEPEDFALWKAIRTEAVREHPHAFGTTLGETLASTDEQWADALRMKHIFAYMDGERIVGVVGYFIETGAKNCHRATVFSAYVIPEYRGRGAMDWLLGAIEYHARDHGVEQLHLEVGTYNEPAVHCYERNGYAIYATEERALKVSGEYVDEYLMRKYL